MKLEIGAGARAERGWTRVDLNPRFADIVADARHLPMIPGGTVTAIRAVDVLEHISYRDTAATLDEWARVCAPGAELYVQVPDADEIMQRYVQATQRVPRLRGGARAQLAIPKDQGLPATPLAGAQWRLLGGHADGERVDLAAGDDWRWNAHFALFSRESLTEALGRAGFDVVRCPTNPFPNLCCEARRR